MATELTPETLKTTVCIKYAGFPSYDMQKSNAPKDANDKYRTITDVDKHFFLRTNPLSFTLEPPTGDTRSLKLNAAKGKKDILFLEYYDNNITSTVIPTNSASTVYYFTTSELSGCNFFIDQLPNGNLVCLHANAVQFSPTKAELQADAFAIKPEAVKAMDRQHSTALEHYPGAKSLYKLRRDEYLKDAKVQWAAKASRGFKDVNFYGGTTVVGFRSGVKWQFWFQTYGHFTYTSGGKKVTTNQERIQAKCFWQQT